MPEPTPENTPGQPEEQHPPDGWELLCIGVIRSEFGRQRSRALDKAMMQLSAEQAWEEDRREAVRLGWWRRLQGVFAMRLAPSFVVGLAVVSLLALLAWILIPLGSSRNQIIVMNPVGCKISDAMDARWGGKIQLKTGDKLPAGVLRLESGVVELTFGSGAKAAVEGPAEFKTTGGNAVELSKGKLSAEVPHPAIGFTVRTPNATVVDLGTRFGVEGKGQADSEVDVFEGKVHVTEGVARQAENGWDLTRNMAMVLDNRGGVTTAAAPESSFPQPSHSILIRPANCSFNGPNHFSLGGFPSTVGYWSGPAFGLTGTITGVKPVEGQGMLRFLSPPRQGGKAVDSVVWQIVDLHAAKAFMTSRGATDLKAWVQFNRIAGDSRTASKFKLTVAAFRGRPEEAAGLWAVRSQTALATAEQELVSDDNPTTWERVEVGTTMPPEADFAVLEIRAIAPKNTPANVDPFPGHFADLIDAKVCLPLRASSSLAVH
ncbi:MAG TPA: FecR family protein [Candidatus Angelobacter sp.]|nr:FecR family protein [Candidatus Angelobacter sp.]